MVDDQYDVEAVANKYEKLLRNIPIEESHEDHLCNSPEDFDVSANEALNEHRMGTYTAVIRKLSVLDAMSNKPLQVIKSGQNIKFKFLINARQDFSSIVLGVSIKNVKGEVIWSDNTLALNRDVALKKGKNVITFDFAIHIREGDYLVYAGLADLSQKDRIELDQRWPLERIQVITLRKMAGGIVHSPSSITVNEEF